MRIGIPRERLANEARVAATPSTVTQLIKLGFSVCIESEAGHLASFEDAAYEQSGLRLLIVTPLIQPILFLKSMHH